MKTDSFPSWLIDILLALTLLSRLPLPHLPNETFAQSRKATWAYPVAGGVIGVIVACAAGASQAAGLPPAVSAGVVLAVSMMVTGAMHEDGLGDTADGFWGGFDPARRLEIMKDSQTGTYGILALIVVTGVRWAAYTTLLQVSLLPIVAVAILSRSGLPGLMAAQRHARNDGLSHTTGRPAAICAFGSLGAASLLAWLCLGSPAFAGLVAALAATGLVGWVAQAKIGGQTGDVLGAAQQISEVIIVAVFLVILT